MPQKSEHDFMGKYPYVCAGTLVPMHILVIMTKNSSFPVTGQRFRIRKGHIMTQSLANR